MTYVDKCDINVMVVNGQNMKFDIKGYVNMKLQYGKTVKLTKFLYVPQAVKNILSVSRFASKGATMGATQENIIIKKKGVSVTLDARK